MIRSGSDHIRLNRKGSDLAQITSNLLYTDSITISHVISYYRDERCHNMTSILLLAAVSRSLAKGKGLPYS